MARSFQNPKVQVKCPKCEKIRTVRLNNYRWTGRGMMRLMCETCEKPFIYSERRMAIASDWDLAEAMS